MVVSKKPFTRASRIVAAVIGAAWLGCGILALVTALKRGQVLLGMLGVLALGLGAMYAIAALRGRPWSLPRVNRDE
jgi:hypothetical protein